MIILIQINRGHIQKAIGLELAITIQIPPCFSRPNSNTTINLDEGDW